jgi:hypothetical protein
MRNVIALEAIAPRSRDVEFGAPQRDSRFSPSFVDLGTLQLRACALSAEWRLRGHKAFPTEYKKSVALMIQRHVRHVTNIRFDDDAGRVHFSAKDEYGVYQYSFEMKADWFAKE